QPAAVEGPGVQGLSVEGDGAQCGGLDLDEGVRGPLVREDGEPDRGAGVEDLVPDGQIEFDRVAVDVEELCSVLRFVAREYGHAGHAARCRPHGTGAVRYAAYGRSGSGASAWAPAGGPGGGGGVGGGGAARGGTPAGARRARSSRISRSRARRRWCAS